MADRPKTSITTNSAGPVSSFSVPSPTPSPPPVPHPQAFFPLAPPWGTPSSLTRSVPCRSSAGGRGSAPGCRCWKGERPGWAAPSWGARRLPSSGGWDPSDNRWKRAPPDSCCTPTPPSCTFTSGRLTPRATGGPTSAWPTTLWATAVAASCWRSRVRQGSWACVWRGAGETSSHGPVGERHRNPLLQNLEPPRDRQTLAARAQLGLGEGDRDALSKAGKQSPCCPHHLWLSL